MNEHKTFWTIVAVLIFATTITIIMGFVLMGINFSFDKYCREQVRMDYDVCVGGLR